MAQTAKGTVAQISKGGVAKGGLGEHPLTIWLLTSAVIVYLYIRRSQLGIDLHPAEEAAKAKPKPKVQPAPKPTINLDTPYLKVPVLPPAGGIDWRRGK